MITLYQFATSPFCEKVRRILNYKQLSFTVHDVPRDKVADYVRVSPTGKFPALDDNGAAVWDSTDIAHYLEKTYPERPLIPSDRRKAALVHVIEDWADESLYFYEMTMRLAWEHNAGKAAAEFAATMPGMTAEQVLPRITQAVGAVVTTQGLGRKPREQVVADARRHFEALDGLLSGGEWLADATITLADIAVISQLEALLYASEALALLKEFPRIVEWRTRVDAAAKAA